MSQPRCLPGYSPKEAGTLNCDEEVIFTALEEPAMSCVMDSFLQMVHAGMHWMRCFCTAVRKKGISALAACRLL